MTDSKLKHHHHHHSHQDDSEIFKNKQLRARRMRKTAKKVLFWTMCFLAAAISAFVFWLYFMA